MATKKQAAVARARIALRQAIDRACIARGEAQWTNGYRAGLLQAGMANEADGLYRKEMMQYDQCS